MARQAPEKSRKTPRQARARATVDAILMAAAQLLRTEGRESTTTNRIAERAGVSIGSLYQYFPNKEAIWEGLRERHADFFASEVRETIERIHDRGFREAVASMIEHMVALHALDGPLHREVYGGEPAFGREVNLEYQGYLQAFFEQNAERLRPIPDPELSAFILVHAMTELVHGVAEHEPDRLRNPHYASELTELLVRFCGDPEDD